MTTKEYIMKKLLFVIAMLVVGGALARPYIDMVESEATVENMQLDEHRMFPFPAIMNDLP